MKKADQVLTARINESQQSDGLIRTDWQVLHSLHEGGAIAHEQLADLMRPFTGSAALAEVLSNLAERRLIDGDGSAARPYRLTAHGQQVHETALVRQNEVRKQAVNGVREADHATSSPANRQQPGWGKRRVTGSR